MLIALAGLRAAEPRSLCDLEEFLPAYDGETVTLRGEVAVELRQGAMTLGANCGYIRSVLIGVYIRATAVHIDTSTEVREAVRQLIGQFERARDSGRMIKATATLGGRLEVIQEGDFSIGFGPRKKAPAAMHLTEVKVAQLPRPEDLPVIPVCELFRDLRSFRDKRVAVRGQVGSTMEGSWLSDDACEGGFVTSGFRWSAALNLSRNDYYTGPTTEEEEARIRESISRGRSFKTSEATETVVGTLRMLDNYSVDCQTGELHGSGLGHLGAAAAQLLVETTLDRVPARPQAPDSRVRAQPCPRLTEEECARVKDVDSARVGGCAAEVRRLRAEDWGNFVRQSKETSARMIDAIRARDTDGVETILREQGPRRGARSQEAFPLAIRFGNIKMLRLLLATGASLYATSPLGPPLHIACLYERWDNFEALAKAGADVDAKDAEGRTTLAACGITNVEALGALLRAGVDINAVVHGKPTPLMRAIDRRSPTAVVKALLEAGAVAYATDDNGDSPLHYAVRTRRADVIPLLLEHGAVLTNRNNAGLTPLDLARQTGAIFEAMALQAKSGLIQLRRRRSRDVVWAHEDDR